MPELDAYKVLQVDSEAEDEVIQAAYRRLARKYHPDMAEGDEAAARMAAINAAWELIGEPDARAAYDQARLAEAGMMGRSSGAGGTGPPSAESTRAWTAPIRQHRGVPEA